MKIGKFRLKSLREIDLKGKKVILRCDFNVPINNGEIVDDTRIKVAVPTINYLLNKKVKKIVILAHLGRPKGFDLRFSLRPVVKVLSKYLGKNIKFKLLSEELENPEKDGIILIENIRFYKKEVLNDEGFCKLLSELGDVFVNDAFSVMHRKHCSTYGLAKFLPSVIGFQVEKELKHLDFTNKKHPIIVVLGGSKLSTKLEVIKSLLNKVDKILIAGAMMFTFYKAKGFCIGRSLYENDFIDEAKTLLDSKKLVLPRDVVVSRDLEKPLFMKVVDADKIPKGYYGVDVGPKTVIDFVEFVLKSKTLFWNGPLGEYEVKDFIDGSKDFAQLVSLIETTYRIVGGGDTLALLRELDLLNKFDFISTGGGASLTFLAEGTLPFLELVKIK